MTRTILLTLTTLAGLGVGAAAQGRADTFWLGAYDVVTINGKPVPAGVRSPFVTFEPDGSVFGATGCNRFSGRWAGTSSNLVVTGLAMTRMACLGPASAVEADFLAWVGRRWRLEKPANGLTVWTGNGRSDLVARR